MLLQIMTLIHFISIVSCVQGDGEASSEEDMEVDGIMKGLKRKGEKKDKMLYSKKSGGKGQQQGQGSKGGKAKRQKS